ncbi:sigma-70 family RNA polymerase sigma factor [Curvivirga sp.]|uniref:sigma-70 family RNA polymerase sigma factor n=1 Tax=Curvivirga sp. TaxID=2856848 RepID=UPI003B5A6E77
MKITQTDGGVDTLSLEAADLASLLKLVAQQDQQAFAILFDHFAPRIKAYMFKLGSSESMAEELTQKTMLKIWQKAALYDDTKAAASTWIFRIARNLRIDDLRKENRFEYDEHDFALTADTSDNAEITLDKAQHAQLIQKALSHLKPDQKEVIDLSFYQGLSHAKIAERLDLPLGTVKSRIRLAFSKLKEHVEVLR